MANPVQLEHRRFTANDVAKMVESGVLRENEPIELLRGELVVVSPKGPEHSNAATSLRDALLKAYQGKGVLVREDKPLLLGDSNLPEPDVVVVTGHLGTFSHRHPRGDEVLLVVELARTSLPLDRSKAAIYASGGVPLFWLVDMAARRIEVHTEPHADGRYGCVRVLSQDEAAELPLCSSTISAREFLD